MQDNGNDIEFVNAPEGQEGVSRNGILDILELLELLEILRVC